MEATPAWERPSDELLSLYTVSWRERNNDARELTEDLTQLLETGGDLSSQDLSNLDLTQFSLTGAQLQGGAPRQLQGACLVGMDLQQAHLPGANLQKAYLFGANLQEANLVGANLQEADLAGANLQEAHLSDANLQEADLSGANLQKAYLAGANLQKAALSRANLQNAHLRGANLQEAGLVDANLQEANLVDANLQEANLQEAKLQKANLLGANLQKADLSVANLSGAKLYSADFTEAVLFDVSWTMYEMPARPSPAKHMSWHAGVVGAEVGRGLYSLVTEDDENDFDQDVIVEVADEALLELDIDIEEVLGTNISGILRVIEVIWQQANDMILKATDVQSIAGGHEKVIQETTWKLLKDATPSQSELESDCKAKSTLKEHNVLLNQKLQKQLVPELQKLNEGRPDIQKLYRNHPDFIELSGPQLMKESENSLSSMLTKKVAAVLFAVVERKLLVPLLEHVEDECNALQESLDLMAKDLGGPVSFLVPGEQSAGFDNVDETVVSEVLQAFKELLTNDIKPRLLEPLRQSLQQRLDSLTRVVAGPVARVMARSAQGGLKDKAAPLIAELEKVEVADEESNVDLRIAAPADEDTSPPKLDKDNPKLESQLKLAVQLLFRGLEKEVKLGLERQFKALLIEMVGFPLDNLLVEPNEKLTLAGLYEKKLTEKLKCDGIRSSIQGATKARALKQVLKLATKYTVDIGGVQGGVDMLLNALKMSPAELTTDQKELEYLLDEVQRLKDKDTTEINWRDTAETWFSVMQLRSYARSQCSQNVMDCFAADEELMQALGSAKAFHHTVGKAPSSFITQLSQGAGSHIRNNAYRYISRISAELIRIMGVQKLQTRIVQLIGSVILALLITTGNFLGRIANEGVSDSKLLAWLIPVSVLVGIVWCTIFGGLLHLYCQGRLGEMCRKCCSCFSCCDEPQYSYQLIPQNSSTVAKVTPVESQ